MDSNRAHAPFFEVHPDWFARRLMVRPIGPAPLRCVYPQRYYEDYLPQVLREIIERYHPDGFADNSWSGLGRALSVLR